MVLADFLQTVKVFPTNFVSTILSAKINAQSCFCSCQTKNCISFPFYCLWYVVTMINLCPNEPYIG